MAQTDKNKQVKDHLLGLAGTLLFHGLLVVLFLTLVFTTPIPPWPEEGGGGGGSGLEINLGTSDQGMNDNQFADVSMPSFENKKAAEVQPDPTEDTKAKTDQTEDLLAQDVEDAPALPSKPETKPKKTADKPAVSQPTQPVAKQPVVDPNALYKKRTNTNDGTTGKPGNQGREDGTTKSGNYGGTGSGSGTGSGTGTGSGIGSGTGSGVGSGNGSGTGGGNSYDLGGRTAKFFPKPTYDSPEQGIIVVSIKVDKNGKVTYASAGAKGTTITEISLRQQAEAAARRTTFTPKADAPDEQRGTITYKFVKAR